MCTVRSGLDIMGQSKIFVLDSNPISVQNNRSFKSRYTHVVNVCLCVVRTENKAISQIRTPNTLFKVI